ncbi:MAG TPA: biotin/lipoyl-containing protein [Terracidiphilus sp.]|nr:biotin/lipoyl-containing protein [Terracidiphilus sp.]
MKLRITIDGQTFEAEVEVIESEETEAAEASREPARIEQRPAPINEVDSGVRVADRGELETVCRSPVTGIVVKIHVKPGQRVQANDVLLVLESMKMETQVSAHWDAAIKSVLVETGNPVKVGQPLLEFEPASSSVS